MPTIEVIACGKVQYSFSVVPEDLYPVNQQKKRRGRPPKLQSSRTETDSSRPSAAQKPQPKYVDDSEDQESSANV